MSISEINDTGDQSIRKSVIDLLTGGKKWVNYALRTISTSSDGTLIENRPQGMSGPARITAISINDTSWTKVPVTAFQKRVSFLIQNKSSTEIMYLNYNGTDSLANSWEIGSKGHYGSQSDESLEVYLRMGSGTSTAILNEVSNG